MPAVHAIIISFFLAHGYTDYQAEALARQAWIESRYDHCARNASGSEYLFQWLGPRRQALHRFTGTTGCPTLVDQLRYADYELRNIPVYRRFFSVSRARAFAVLRNCWGWGRC